MLQLKIWPIFSLLVATSKTILNLKYMEGTLNFNFKYDLHVASVVINTLSKNAKLKICSLLYLTVCNDFLSTSFCYHS